MSGIPTQAKGLIPPTCRHNALVLMNKLPEVERACKHVEAWLDQFDFSLFEEYHYRRIQLHRFWRKLIGKPYHDPIAELFAKNGRDDDE